MIDQLLFAIELVGVASFSIAGSIIAIDKEMDILGVILLAITTAFGGGIFRDLILGRTPAFFVSMYLQVAICVAVSIITFVLAAAFKRWFVREEEIVKRINNYADALGLGVFAVTTVKLTITICPDKGAFLPIMLGMIAAVGGGVVRDIFLDGVPSVFRKHVYALATLIGAVVYYVLERFVVPTSLLGEAISSFVGISIVFVIRALAIHFRWNLPKAIRHEALEQEIEKDGQSAKKEV